MSKKISMEDLEDSNIDSSIEKLKQKDEILEEKRARISSDENSDESKSKYWSVFNFVFLGIISSMIGWAAAEQLTRPDTPNRPFSNLFNSNINFSSGMFFVIVGFFIFFFIVYWDTLVYSFNKDSFIGILKTLPFIILILTTASIINNGIFSFLSINVRESAQSLEYEEIYRALTLVRSGSWAIWGTLAGMIIGLFPTYNKKSLSNGAIGGFIGGAVGGYGFNLITTAVRANFENTVEVSGTLPGALGRFFAIIFFGFAVGIAIGLVKALRTKYWIEILSGGMSGKQFLFESDEITIGSLYTNDITLIKDPKIPEYACRIETQDSSPSLVNDKSYDFLEVNNTKVENIQNLEDGSIITVGDTVLKFYKGSN